jgi:UDP-GlcNAc:undecaprenyl-phosphate GlcNAc-1-phosphate transferase
VREYLLTLVVAAAATYLLVGIAGRMAYRVGAVPPVRERDMHALPVPRLGGVAMLGGLLAGMLVAAFLPRLSRVFTDTADARALLSAAVVVCLVGVADDILDLDALTKLAGQLLAAGLMVVQGLQLYWLPLPSGTFVLSPLMGALLTVLIVVVTVNAVNFVDGLDGLAAGIIGIGAAATFSYTYLLSVDQGLSRMTTPALAAAVLTGVCAGFLPHNVYRARIFMGDSGSMLIGLVLAAASISLTARFDSQTLPDSTFLVAVLPLLLPVAVIAIPFVDLLTAVWRRTREGRSMFSADKQHLHHRMLDLGHSHRRAVALLWFWAALLAFGVVVVSLVGGAAWAFVLAGFAVAIALTVLGGARDRAAAPAQAGS